MSKEESAFARLTPEQQAFALEILRVVGAQNASGSQIKELQSAVVDSLKRLVSPSREAQESAPPKALRHRLPGERASITHKFAIAGHEGYITVGLYKDGTPGELFIRMAKEGSTVSGLMDSFATAVSLALQHGVPLKLLCDKFQHTRFEPSGFTGNQEIPIAKSVMDYIFRWLEIRFVSGQQFPLFKDMVQAPALSAAISTQPLALEDRGLEDRGLENRGAQAPSPAYDNRVAQPPSAVYGANDTMPPQGGLSRSQEPEASSSIGFTDRGIYHASDAMKDLVDMGDAPSCHVCGAIMTRNGSCYRCMSCGSTSGCS